MINDLFSAILFLLIGGSTGFLSGFLGVGGGFVLVPLLIFLGIPTTTAIGSSLAYIVFTAISGVIQHYKQRNFNLKLALLISLGGIVTAQIGAIMTLYIETKYLEILLGLALLIIAIRMFFQGYFNKEGKSNDTKYVEPKIFTMIVIGLFTGFLSGLLGVGGGFILVPLLVLISHIPVHTSIGTSLMALVGLSISGAVRHWLIGHINPYLVGVLTIGGILGAPLGAKACKKVSPKKLQKVFSLILFAFAFKLLGQI